MKASPLDNKQNQSLQEKQIKYRFNLKTRLKKEEKNLIKRTLPLNINFCSFFLLSLIRSSIHSFIYIIMRAELRAHKVPLGKVVVRKT